MPRVSKFTLAVVFCCSTIFQGHAIAGDKVVRAALQNSQPKYILYNPSEKGLCGEIYQRLSERLAKRGVELKVPSHYSLIKVILDDLAAGEADIFCGAGRNAKREALYNYSKTSVYDVSNVVAVHRDSQAPKSMQDIITAGKPIAAYKGASATTFLHSHEGIVKSETDYKNLVVALQAVVEKKETYFYYHDLALPYLIRKHKLPLHLSSHKFRTVPQWMLYSKSLSVELRELLDLELIAMDKTGELEKIQQKYQTL